jgi:hypothetical protein
MKASMREDGVRLTVTLGIVAIVIVVLAYFELRNGFLANLITLPEPPVVHTTSPTPTPSPT